MMHSRRTTRPVHHAIAAVALTALAACGGSTSAKPDDALRNDLTLANQAQPAPGQQVVSPQELGPNGQPLATTTQPTTAAPAPQVIERERVVYRDRPVRRSSSSSGTYSNSGTVYHEPARQPMTRNTKRDAAIGGAAGAILGATTSHDKVKGGLIGGAAGAILGGVIGNNVDVKRH